MSAPSARPSALPPNGVVNLAGRVVALVGDSGPLVEGIRGALTRGGATVASLHQSRGCRFAPAALTRDEPVALDLADQPTAGAGLAAVADRHGRLDALVFAHFPAAAAQPAAMTDEHWQATWEDTMRALIFSLQGAYAQFTKGSPPGGRVVVLVPALAMTGAPGYSATAATAEGQRLLMKSVALQWGPADVTANAVAVANSVLLPGTPDFEFSLAERALGRTGDPDTDIGAVVSFLCSDLARFVTGTTLFCEGGLWMSAA